MTSSSKQDNEAKLIAEAAPLAGELDVSCGVMSLSSLLFERGSNGSEVAPVILQKYMYFISVHKIKHLTKHTISGTITRTL